MQIRYATLDKMSGLTNREMDFLLYVARYQDENGTVRGVYYKDLCRNNRENFHMCKQTFYNVLRSLKQKGIIQYVQNMKGDYDITIKDNKGYNPQEKALYIGINRAMFRSKAFYSMRAKEKYLLLDFMRLTAASGSHSIGMDNFYKKYEKILGVSKRVIRQYLHALRRHFIIYVKNGKYCIHFLKEKFANLNAHGKHGAREQWREYMVRVLARRAGAKEALPGRDVKDLGVLIAQYAKLAADKGYDILQLMKLCIEKSMDGKPGRGPNPAYVHKLLIYCMEEE